MCVFGSRTEFLLTQFPLHNSHNSLRPIVIGSLWRRCTARLGVAEVRSNVATNFMSQYTNFIGRAAARRNAPMQSRVIRVGPNKQTNPNTGGLSTKILNTGGSSDFIHTISIPGGGVSYNQTIEKKKNLQSLTAHQSSVAKCAPFIGHGIETSESFGTALQSGGSFMSRKQKKLSQDPPPKKERSKI